MGSSVRRAGDATGCGGADARAETGENTGRERREKVTCDGMSCNECRMIAAEAELIRDLAFH